MEVKLFGKLKDGRDAYLYTLKCGDTVATVTNYGCTIVSLLPFGDRHVIGGFDSLSDYEADRSDQGATVGRVANRIENAEFTMDGAVYMLTANSNGNCLHGGVGFHRKLWDVLEYDGRSILMSCLSTDGDDGFPGDLVTKIRFTVIDKAIIISYEAIPSAKTPIALTNHAFFNLDGMGRDIKEHELKIYADTYTEVDERLIPTGVRPNVEGTVYDLREFKKIGLHFGPDFDGYDRNYILCPKVFKIFEGKSVGLCAELKNSDTLMKFYTDQPGVQLYTANFLGGEPKFRGNVERIKHGAVCLEAQTEPNATKHGECFYDVGEVYTQTTVYEFESLDS